MTDAAFDPEEAFIIDASPAIIHEQTEEGCRSGGGMYAEVTGLRVIRNGEVIQEWHRDAQPTRPNTSRQPTSGSS